MFSSSALSLPLTAPVLPGAQPQTAGNTEETGLSAPLARTFDDILAGQDTVRAAIIHGTAASVAGAGLPEGGKSLPGPASLAAATAGESAAQLAPDSSQAIENIPSTGQEAEQAAQTEDDKALIAAILAAPRQLQTTRPQLRAGAAAVAHTLVTGDDDARPAKPAAALSGLRAEASLQTVEMPVVQAEMAAQTMGWAPPPMPTAAFVPDMDAPEIDAAPAHTVSARAERADAALAGTRGRLPDVRPVRPLTAGEPAAAQLSPVPLTPGPSAPVPLAGTLLASAARLEIEPVSVPVTMGPVDDVASPAPAMVGDLAARTAGLAAMDEVPALAGTTPAALPLRIAPQASALPEVARPASDPPERAQSGSGQSMTAPMRADQAAKPADAPQDIPQDKLQDRPQPAPTMEQALAMTQAPAWTEQPATTTGMPAGARAEARAERIDFATLVDTLARAREEASPRTLNIAVTNTDFGRVSLRFDSSGDSLSVAMSSADPGFVRAVNASAEAAAASADTRGQPSQSEARSQQQAAMQASADGHGQRQPQAQMGRDDERAAPQAAPSARRADASATRQSTGPEAGRPDGIYA